MRIGGLSDWSDSSLGIRLVSMDSRLGFDFSQAHLLCFDLHRTSCLLEAIGNNSYTAIHKAYVKNSGYLFT